MNCKKCGTPFKNGEKFCSKCGDTLEVTEEVKIKENFGDILINMFKYIIKFLIKPVDAISEFKNSMTNPIFALILGGLVSLVMVLSNMIVEIFSVAVVKKYTFGIGYETSWDFSRISNLNFLELIFRNFFIYAFIILVIGGVFYLSSLVIKKEMNFFKSLTIASSSIIPFVLCTFILVPILTLAWSHFVLIGLLGFVYSISLLCGLYNEELKLKGNIKIYYFAVNVGILAVISYFALVSLITTTLFEL